MLDHLHATVARRLRHLSPQQQNGINTRVWPAATARKLSVIVILAVLHASTAVAQRGQIAPEAATGTTSRALVTASRHMIATANPHATKAGLEILRAGGSAIDAAIAAQLVLGLVEPQSSGLGGGAFILHHDARTNELMAYDGRERAPAAARPDRFLKGHLPIPFDRAVHSGLSVGVPGLVRLIQDAHRAHGRVPWASLFEPAITLAEAGFIVSSRLNLLLHWMGSGNFAPDARRYFFGPDGFPRRAGETLQNPDYAATLRHIATGGPASFYSGTTARAIVTAVTEAPNAPGDMTAADLEDYAAVTRPPLCTAYRGYRICGMGPPSSGGIVVSQTLRFLERFDLGRGPSAAMNASAMHLIAEAQKLAYADRDRYIADPDFVPVPPGLSDPGYLDQRGEAIRPDRSMPKPEAGEPPGAARQTFGIDATLESVGTTHLSVIDAEGNAVSMTSTIEAAFGSRLWAAGFLLNNELTDFSFRPADAAGQPVANRVEGGKRPRSSMAPTIVYDADGRVFAVLGSPGGARIPLYVVKALVALIDWNLDAQEAAALPNFGSRGSAFEIEAGWHSLSHALKMSALGHRIAIDLMTSGTHIIVRRGDGMEGAADPRREGEARGD